MIALITAGLVFFGLPVLIAVAKAFAGQGPRERPPETWQQIRRRLAWENECHRDGLRLFANYENPLLKRKE